MSYRKYRSHKKYNVTYHGPKSQKKYYLFADDDFAHYILKHSDKYEQGRSRRYHSKLIDFTLDHGRKPTRNEEKKIFEKTSFFDFLDNFGYIFKKNDVKKSKKIKLNRSRIKRIHDYYENLDYADDEYVSDLGCYLHETSFEYLGNNGASYSRKKMERALELGHKPSLEEREKIWQKTRISRIFNPMKFYNG